MKKESKESMESQESHKEKVNVAVREFARLKAQGGVSLKPKSTTHFMRERVKKNTLDLRSFNAVLSVNVKEGYVEVEGLTRFYDILKETLQYGYMPTVVPEMRNITIGGAISGLGVEATSFRYGLVHESVREIEVLTGSGDVITCSKDMHESLYRTLPNSLGTIGYILKCKMDIIPVKKYIRVWFVRFSTAEELFSEMKKRADESIVDFIDGVIYEDQQFVMIVASFTDTKEKNESVINMYAQPWYRYVQDMANAGALFLVEDYFWRWDIDVYWGTGLPGILGWTLHNSVLRTTVLRPLLRSDRLLRFNHWLQFSPFAKSIKKLLPLGRVEPIVQDAGVDIDDCARFFSWYKEKMAIYPIWLCPVKTHTVKGYYPLSAERGRYVVDIGFYSEKKLSEGMADNHYNRLLEKQLTELHAIKGLYSLSFYTKDEFWKSYDREMYETTKHQFDPDTVFPTLYEKVAGRVTK